MKPRKTNNRFCLIYNVNAVASYDPFDSATEGHTNEKLTSFEKNAYVYLKKNIWNRYTKIEYRDCYLGRIKSSTSFIFCNEKNTYIRILQKKKMFSKNIKELKEGMRKILNKL